MRIFKLQNANYLAHPELILHAEVFTALAFVHAAVLALHLAHLQPLGHAFALGVQLHPLVHLLATLIFAHVAFALGQAFAHVALDLHLAHLQPFAHLLVAFLHAVLALGHVFADFAHAVALALQAGCLSLKHSQPVSNTTAHTAISTFFILLSLFYLVYNLS